jgi:predicted RecA/RadA family phage recombinase
VTSGQGVLVGNLFDIAATTVAESRKRQRRNRDGWRLRAAEAGQRGHRRVAWDNSAKQVVLPDTGM